MVLLSCPSAFRNQSHLRLLPRAAQVLLPSTAVLRPATRYVVSLSYGSLVDSSLLNHSEELRIGFSTLSGGLFESRRNVRSKLKS